MSWLSRALRGLAGKHPTGPVSRSALIFHPRQPVADWVDACDSEHVVPAEITLRNVQVVLVDQEVEEDLDEWLGLHWSLLFEWWLNGWYTDPDLWPRDRTLDMFREWFDVEVASGVLALGSEPFEVEDP